MIKNLTFGLSVLFILSGWSFHATSQSFTWKRNDHPSREVKEKAAVWARKAVIYDVAAETLKQELRKAPLVQDVSFKSGSIKFSVPMPDGRFADFRLVESPVMEPGLVDAYPSIKTYAGQGIDDPTATMRCDLTPFGFHAMILSANGTVFIDPVDRWNPESYVSYYKRDALPQDLPQNCLIEHSHDEEPGLPAKQSVEGELRTYRLALACTGEYASYHGGTVVGALSGMVTTINRVNGVYERELGIHMNIIANDTLLIYLNSSTDPYSNNNGSTMLTQNQNNVTSLIGSANYDIGHVFSTGGGGIAGLGVICNNNTKAKGVTGLNTPIGDAFDIDYVAHEMGHQYGANHTFNSTTGSCSGNRVASAAYEPGSASTVMGYAGICSNQDLQMHSDDYFHTKSFDEIVFYTHSGTGNTCPVLTTDANNAPLLTIPGNFNIPLSTPFYLTASATDPDGDVVTYCWEEYDLGPSGNWNAPSGNAPIFRSFDPTVSGTRLFPKLVNILNNSTTIGELKPSYARTLNFRCIVRDNHLAGAGVTYNTTSLKVNVIATPGPFAVLTPNTTITWVTNTVDSVTWSVNGSDQAPVSCSSVNVLLSLDGGYTWPITLGSGVPNTGSFSFVVPDTTTYTARVKVEGAGNIFFDINDKNFILSESAGIATADISNQVVVYPNPASDKVTLLINTQDQGTIRIRLFDGSGKELQHQTAVKNGPQLKTEITTESLAPGVYTLQLISNNSIITKKIIKK